jgi:2-keto-4-pentenoate hydratase/2-oxohepta-3-ene-1,7-dioic acid hydratase in catechol pathway
VGRVATLDDHGLELGRAKQTADDLGARRTPGGHEGDGRVSRMKIANVSGRAHLVVDGRLVDVEKASGGRLPADPMALIEQLDSVGELDVPDDAPPVAGTTLGPPVTHPSKIIAIGLNFRGHAEENDLPIPEEPVVFAKWPNSLCGPEDEIVIAEGRTRVDWEAEVVVALKRGGRRIKAADAWSHVAGVMCGQDVSDRAEQFRAMKQFTVAKSNDTYSPTGPWLVTLDEIPDPDDISIACRLDGEEVQSSRTSDLIFSVPALIEWLSHRCTLEAGDLIFTGTPGGVGDVRTPPRYLGPGMILETEAGGIGTMRNRCVAGPA